MSELDTGLLCMTIAVVGLGLLVQYLLKKVLLMDQRLRELETQQKLNYIPKDIHRN